MGRGGKPKLTFRCSKCGFEHDYNEMPYEDSYYASRVEPIDEEEYKRQNARNEMALSNGYISRDTYMRYKKIIQSSYQLYCEKYKKLSVEERDRRVEAQKNLRRKGVISQEEYEQSIRDLNIRCVDYVEPKQEKADNIESLTEDQKIEMLIKYKKLLDDGVITLEEYEKKKKELLFVS